MYFSDRVTLRNVTITLDNYGDDIESITDIEVWANKKSVARSEFYNANMAGLKVDAVFVVHTEDFNDQERVLYNNIEYKIVRTYQKGEGIVELMCSVREVN